jgi:ribulose-5-phosphate 4-epimerase/fuculose-1-phosphate aldolase
MTATAIKLDTGADPVRQARIDLAAAYQLASRFGYDDGIWNHFTLTVPDAEDRFLVKPHGLLMSEVTASNLIVVDRDGTVVEGEGYVETTAFCIHSKIHELVPGAECVLHAHPPYCNWLADSEDGRLIMFDQDSLRYLDRVAYDEDYQGLALDTAEGERMARAFGDKAVLVSRSHGVTVVAKTVAEAFDDLHYMEHVCKRQYRIVSSGNKPAMISETVMKRLQNQDQTPYRAESARLHFAALKRTLDRDGSDYMA